MKIKKEMAMKNKTKIREYKIESQLWMLDDGIRSWWRSQTLDLFVWIKDRITVLVRNCGGFQCRTSCIRQSYVIVESPLKVISICERVRSTAIQVVTFLWANLSLLHCVLCLLLVSIHFLRFPFPLRIVFNWKRYSSQKRMKNLNNGLEYSATWNSFAEIFFIADSLCLGLMCFFFAFHGQNQEKDRWMRSTRQNEISDALKCINPLSVEEHNTVEREKELFVFCFATIYTFSLIEFAVTQSRSILI